MGRWTINRDRIVSNIQKVVKPLEKQVSDETTRLRKRLAVSEVDKCSSNDSKPSTSNIIEAHISSIPGLQTQSIPHDTPLNPENLKPGLVFILNHRTFDDKDLAERRGCTLDITRLEETFKKFDMVTKTVPNGTKSEVVRTMLEVETLDFSSHACLVLVIMSHGYENNILAARDGIYSLYKDILYPVLRNGTLVGRSKMIFVQSCKGLVDLTLEVDSKVVPTKVPDEVLQFHSCFEGYVSYRVPTDGSIFIQTLCDKLYELGDNNDIRDICNDVITSVKTQFVDLQIPMMYTNLTRPFVFGHYKTKQDVS